MKQEQKLEAIKAKCMEIIALGEKRTRGEWKIMPEELHRDYLRIRGTSMGGRYKIANVCGLKVTGDEPTKLIREPIDNAAFIAACAGVSEAMARSTLIALENLESLAKGKRSVAGDAAIYDLGRIIESWPDELLTP